MDLMTDILADFFLFRTPKEDPGNPSVDMKTRFSKLDSMWITLPET